MKVKIIVPLLVVMALLNFVDGLAMNLVLALGLVALAYLLFSSNDATAKNIQEEVFLLEKEIKLRF